MPRGTLTHPEAHAHVLCHTRMSCATLACPMPHSHAPWHTHKSRGSQVPWITSLVAHKFRGSQVSWLTSPVALAHVLAQLLVFSDIPSLKYVCEADQNWLEMFRGWGEGLSVEKELASLAAPACRLIPVNSTAPPSLQFLGFGKSSPGLVTERISRLGG